jgi:hypothetical protein
MPQQIERYQSYVRVCEDGRYEVYPLPTYQGPFVLYKDVAPFIEEASSSNDIKDEIFSNRLCDYCTNSCKRDILGCGQFKGKKLRPQRKLD